MESNTLKILTVDDYPDNHTIVSALIREEYQTAEILTALSGRDGIHKAAQEDPDLILLDALMPDMDGFETCLKLKDDTSTEDIPVVFVTALKDDSKNRIKALKCGADGFLTKPIEKSELIAQINAMKKIREASRAKRDMNLRLKEMVDEKTGKLEEAYKRTKNLVKLLRAEVEEKEAIRLSLLEAQRMGQIGSFDFNYYTNRFDCTEECLRIFDIDPRIFRKEIEQVFDCIHPEDRQRVIDEHQKVRDEGGKINYTCRVLTKEDKVRHIQVKLVASEASEHGVIAASGVIQDITDQKNAEEAIYYIASHDSLTDLYNRNYYESQLTAISKGDHYPLAILMVDINGLKLINDSYGHKVGDEILQKAAQALVHTAKSRDLVARFGGDEFIILMKNSHEEDVRKRIDFIKAMVHGVRVENLEVSLSFGYAITSKKGAALDRLQQNAENQMFTNKMYDTNSNKSKMIELIMNALFEKSKREMLHSRRVSHICQIIAENMDLPEQDVKVVTTAGLMHDIGKIGVSEMILNKNGSLDEAEWSEIHRHPETGFRILSTSREFSEIAVYILEHHERWDGSGYPSGLSGDNISLYARIISVADAYDAMTSKRSYRAGITKEEARAELIRCSGGHFDPDIVKVFVDKCIDLVD